MCILDFYVHESQQRKGYGKVLFEEVLKSENLKAFEVAIDRPSAKFLGFLQKHYNLSNFYKQANNFVVFDKFFTTCCHVDYGKSLKRSFVSPSSTFAQSPVSQCCSDTIVSPHQHKWPRNFPPSQSPPHVSTLLDTSMEESTLHKTVSGSSNSASGTVSPSAVNNTAELGNFSSGSSNHSIGPVNTTTNKQNGFVMFRNSSDSRGAMGKVRSSQNTEDWNASLPCGRATYLTLRDKTHHRRTNREEAHMRNPLQWINSSHGNSTSLAQFSRYGGSQGVGPSKEHPPKEYNCPGNVLGASFSHNHKLMSSVANRTRDKWKSYIF